MYTKGGYMESMVKVGGQWITLEAHQRIKRFEWSLEVIGIILILSAMFALAFMSM